LLRNLNVVVHL